MENAPSFDFSENELSALGYQLSAMQRPKDAIEIFKLNVEMFPASTTTHDNLAEAYLANGQKDPALAN